MKSKRLPEGQIIGILQQAQVDMKAVGLCRSGEELLVICQRWWTSLIVLIIPWLDLCQIWGI